MSNGNTFIDRYSKQISFFRNIVALSRDLTIIVVGLLTVAILYLGGEPKNLTAVDWAFLVASAFGVIIIPVIIFFLIRLWIVFTNAFLSFPIIPDPTAPIPTGFFARYWRSILRVIRRQGKEQAQRDFEEFFRKFQTKVEELKTTSKSFRLLAWTFDKFERFSGFVNHYQPYVWAFFSTWLVGKLFWKVLLKYLPS